MLERFDAVPGIAIFRFADAQARVRARLGAMPSEADWRYLADASDLDNLIERMRSKGLAHWVADLPRSPDTATIERRLQRQLQQLLEDVCSLLPERWRGVRRSLRLAGNLAWARRLLTESDSEAPAGIDAALKPLFSLPPDEREKKLEQTPYHRYLSAASAFDRWLADFRRACPAVSGREAYVLARIDKSIRRHRAQLLGLRRQAAGVPDPAGQWRLRDQLATELRGLAGGDPFHAGLILAYCLLEVLQYERCRALLIARARGWRRPEITGSAA